MDEETGQLYVAPVGALPGESTFTDWIPIPYEDDLADIEDDLAERFAHYWAKSVGPLNLDKLNDDNKAEWVEHARYVIWLLNRTKEIVEEDDDRSDKE